MGGRREEGVIDDEDISESTGEPSTEGPQPSTPAPP